jgi:negative modulator of initiation of replication
MKTIEIDDEIYGYLLKNTTKFSESPSDVLRRLLKIEKSDNQNIILPAKNELTQSLNDPKFPRFSSNVVKYIYILGIVYKQNPDDFEKVLILRGTHRKYFGKSKEEIEATGKSQQPKQISGSDYWALTCTSTPQKMDLLAKVLIMLDYSKEAIKEAVSTLKYYSN